MVFVNKKYLNLISNIKPLKSKIPDQKVFNVKQFMFSSKAL